jgi:hypothetical protein
MTEESKNTRKYILTLLTALLAVPGLTIIIIRFILGDIGWIKFAILLMGDIVGDIFLCLDIMFFYYLYKFTSANPSYKNYSIKSNLNYSKFLIILVVVYYIIKLLLYIFSKNGEMLSVTFYFPCFFVCSFPIINRIMLSDKNLYISSRLQTYSIDKIKIDNIDEIGKAISRHDKYVNLQFHYDDKEVKERIKRTDMMEIREIIER